MEERSHGVKWTLLRYAGESSQVSTHLETPRESTPLTEMNGESWNTPPLQEEKLQIQNRECIALKQQSKVWRSERKHDVLRACRIKSAGFESTNTGHRGQ